MDLPGLDDVRAAAERIAPSIHKTPVLRASSLDIDMGVNAHFKCENLQKTGSFKVRGALNAMLRLDHEAIGRGVITHSSGNHGAALAWAASLVGASCTVVMDQHASVDKIAAVQRYGGVVKSTSTGDRRACATELVDRLGGVMIDQHENLDVVAGHATLAAEFMEQVPGLDVMVAPVSGGGLLAGCALIANGAVTENGPSRLRVVGGEPARADDAYRSLLVGERQPAVRNADTIADALVGALGAVPFRILTATQTEIVTVSETEIIDAARTLLHRLKVLVEPSAAVAMAAAVKLGAVGQSIGVILTGGNTDLSWAT